SDFSNVFVNAGTLNVGAGGEIAAAAGGTLTAMIATGATLQVDGAFGCGTANDSIAVSGSVVGTGTISQCGGDDTLTLTDTADLSGFVGAIDGGTNSAGDTVALNATSALTFAASTVTNYESLRKEGTGIATLVGSHVFTAGTIIDGGTLQVDDLLETPTVALGDGTRLSIDGTVQAAGAGQVTLTGSSGSNTVVVNAGATLLASGDLGDASDTLDVAGTLDTAIGFNLGAGDDTFIVHDGTSVLGAVIGGTGLDTRVYDITGLVNVGALQEFEGLIKRNSGILNINGPAATTDLEVVGVEGGILNVGAAASVLGVNTTSVRSGATLQIDGLYTGTTGADTFSVAGVISGAGSISLDAGDDLLVLNDGANLDGLATPLSGGAGNDTVTVDITGSATLGGVGAFETLVKENSGTLHIDGPAASDLAAVTVNGGVLSVGAAGNVSGVRTTMIATGATLNVAGTYQGSAVEDLFETKGTVVGSIDLLDGDDLLRVHADVADLDDAIFNGSAGTDTVAYAHDTDRAFQNTAFSTFESLRKEGTGTLAIAGTLDAFAQSVVVATGAVDLQNAIVQTAQFTIEQPAALRGAGTLSGDLTNAGLLAPGHSPGTLAIGGNYMQTATGVLVSEISRAGDDRLDVTKIATLGGTQRLQIEYGYYLAGTTHTLISAAGGVSGDFTTIEANASALLPYQRSVDTNSETVTFTLRPTVSVTTPDSNRGRFAAWLDGQISGGLVTPELETYLDTLIQQTTDAQVEALLGELADPPASATQGTASVVASSFAGSVLDRFAAEGARCALASVASEALNCGWTAGLRQWGGADGDAFGPRHDWTIDGTQLGFERRLASGWAVGVTFGYGSADIHDANDSYAQLRAPTGGLYAQFSGERLNASVIALYSDVENDVTRRATVGSDVRSARASFSSGTIGAGGRLDWRFGGETGPLVQPYLEAFYDRTGSASFVESGAAMNLAVHARAREGLRGTLGVLVADDYEGYGHVFRPSLQVGVAHQFLDTYSEMDVRLGGQMPLRVRGVALERTSLALKAELAMSLGRSASVSIGYGGELAENFAQHQFNVRAQIAW
ncbi:MAG TPA: autotransporter domain-containing protein, partial [Povalibacter sp.]|nr:autotransporter domain-containing protein [Povalibacter sp.]